MNNWPIYFKDQILTFNPESPQAIICGWTRREEIARRLEENTHKFAAIGQLYSAQRGLDPLIRNLLANPRIRKLYLMGQDLSHSMQALWDFIEKGFDHGIDRAGRRCWRVDSDIEAYIDIEVPYKALIDVRAYVELDRTCTVGSVAELGKAATTTWPDQDMYRNPEVFEKVTYEPETYPGPKSATVIRGRSVAEVWVKLLQEILTFGKLTRSHRGPIKELLNLTTVIDPDFEDPNKNSHFEGMPESYEHFQKYTSSQVLSPTPPEGFEYTYGSLMHAYQDVLIDRTDGTASCINVFNQIDAIVNKFLENPDQLSCTVSLWDVAKNSGQKSGTPCWNQLWFRIRDGRMYMTVVIRSNDMWGAYPENVMALRVLLNRICFDLKRAAQHKGLNDFPHIYEGLKNGHVTIVSESAHIYEDSWGNAQAVVDNYLEDRKLVQAEKQRWDPKGNWVIEIDREQSEIVAQLYALPEDGGHLLKELRAMKAFQVQDEIMHLNLISSVSHGVYVGRQLALAEASLKQSRPFTQDK